ncbi:hypothetical protein RO3G_17295 [Rhizopus delemar RA 99-880]|uniref:Uncharacterized protein n=1 Tax=Rhizopus delemar (strain RA 99-880 / ATCC MYA-4621 / FGSC 9543 / NRRL 43880) TaxID=246409 RepID=I1CVV4_RHIO9|nr:hypothetical protein RO3G_17295 [Rhizopus delemar RA 99-880]|eukprot:EIE92584.1 hypothetical protein RO3G_17295 [Rhizopus delemar RA 99-880]
MAHLVNTPLDYDIFLGRGPTPSANLLARGLSVVHRYLLVFSRDGAGVGVGVSAPSRGGSELS